jgi:hypothetical protein
MCHCGDDSFHLVLLVFKVLIEIHDSFTEFVLSSSNCISFLLLRNKLLLKCLDFVVQQLHFISIFIRTLVYVYGVQYFSCFFWEALN